MFKRKFREISKSGDTHDTDIETKRELLDPSRMPRHIAVIMDGNGRWARSRHMNRLEGHRRGLKAAKDIIQLCKDIEGVDCITLYAFSTENWKRPKAEIKGLMLLMKYFLRRETREMVENRIRFRTIGSLEHFPEFVRKEIEKAKNATKKM